MSMRTSGRHGSIPSGELEQIVVRNGQFLSVRRAGGGDGQAGFYNSITGEYLQGLGGGRIPEWSYMRHEAPHLVRGWRNILYELLHKRKLSPTREIKRLLGESLVRNVLDYGLSAQPQASPEPSRVYMDGTWTSGH
jgi:hypothetical protein